MDQKDRLLGIPIFFDKRIDLVSDRVVDCQEVIPFVPNQIK